MSRPTKIKLAAYGVLLLTLFLPFSRCSRGTPAPAPAAALPGAAAGDSTDLPAGESTEPKIGDSPATLLNTLAATPAAAPTITLSPWYHLFEKNSPEAEYKYGMDLLMESWAVPTTLPKEFEPMLLVPGRMFYVWPLATLAVVLWWPPVRWRRSFHFIEFTLGLGGMWWAMMGALMNEAMRGFYLAETVLALYALTALYELIIEWRRIRRERRNASTPTM